MSKEKSGKRNSFDIKNFVVTSASLALLLSTFRYAFTQKQVKEIRERDNNQCQNPYCMNGGKIKHGKGQVHHALPQRYAVRIDDEMNVDFPENGILLCLDCHVGWNGVHPDISGAKTTYRSDLREINAAVKAGHIHPDLADLLKLAVECRGDMKALVAGIKDRKLRTVIKYTIEKEAYYGRKIDSYKLVFAWRKSLLNKKEIYWDPKWDGIFFKIAIQRTMEARQKGWKFSAKSRGMNSYANKETVRQLQAYLDSLTPAELGRLYLDFSDGKKKPRVVMINLHKKAMNFLI